MFKKSTNKIQPLSTGDASTTPSMLCINDIPRQDTVVSQGDCGNQARNARTHNEHTALLDSFAGCFQMLRWASTTNATKKPDAPCWPSAAWILNDSCIFISVPTQSRRDQILAAFEVASSGIVEKYGMSFATVSILPGCSPNKCGVNAGDQQNVKSLQGATVAALAASTAAKKNKERVIMALLRCSGGKLGIILKKHSCVDLLLSRPIVFCCDTYLTARYPTSDSDCFAVFDPSELRAKAGLGHIRLFSAEPSQVEVHAPIALVVS